MKSIHKTPTAQDAASVLLGIYPKGTTKGRKNIIGTVMLSTLYKREKNLEITKIG